MRARQNFYTCALSKSLTVFWIANIGNCLNSMFIDILFSDRSNTVTAFEHQFSCIELFTIHPQMIWSCVTLLALLCFTVGPRTIKPLFSIENCMLWLNGLSSWIFFRSVVWISRCKVILGLALYTLDDIEIADFPHDFILQQLKSIS